MKQIESKLENFSEEIKEVTMCAFSTFKWLWRIKHKYFWIDGVEYDSNDFVAVSLNNVVRKRRKKAVFNMIISLVLDLRRNHEETFTN